MVRPHLVAIPLRVLPDLNCLETGSVRASSAFSDLVLMRVAREIARSNLGGPNRGSVQSCRLNVAEGTLERSYVAEGRTAVAYD